MLNATYEPLSVVPSRRAACLVLADKADIVEDDGTHLHSESLSVPNPVVIRLRYVVKVPYSPTHSYVAPCCVRARRALLSVLRRHGRLDRSHHAEVAWRPTHLGERRRGMPPVQPPQARPHTRRGRDATRQTGARSQGVGMDHRVGQPGSGGVEALSRARQLTHAVVASRAQLRRRWGVSHPRATNRPTCRDLLSDRVACLGAGVIAARRLRRSARLQRSRPLKSFDDAPAAAGSC